MAELTEKDKTWAVGLKFPPTVNMFKRGNQENFIQAGTQIFSVIEEKIKKAKPGVDISTMDILDFGCGVGRVVLPFQYKYHRPNHACDLKKAYIDYLQEVCPQCNSIRVGASPPLPYPNRSFDVFYAISVWTHMSWKNGKAWLEEVRRLLRPGGIAIISTSSYGVLNAHRKSPKVGHLWAERTDADLKREGHIFVAQNYPGIETPYGEIVYDPDWLKAEWSKIIPVVDQGIRVVGGQGGRQDINVLQMPLD